MRPELQNALLAARKLPSEELPRLLGDLEEIRCTALARLTSPPPPAQPEEWLDVEGAAALLKVSPDTLYHKAKSLPFAKRMGKRLLFSRAGIEKYLRTS